MTQPDPGDLDAILLGSACAVLATVGLLVFTDVSAWSCLTLGLTGVLSSVLFVWLHNKFARRR